MQLRNVGAVQLDLPVEDADIYPDISKGKGSSLALSPKPLASPPDIGKTRNQSSDLNKGKNGLSSQSFV